MTLSSWAWDVPDYFWILWWRSRRARTLMMQVSGEPERKGSGGGRAAAGFQQQVMDEMERYGRFPLTGRVALDLHFRATRRNPPSIHRVAKHTLDILGPALPGNVRTRRRHVLYRDDRQVKFLYVDLDQAWQAGPRGAEREPGTFIIARRASDVTTYLCMAHRLSRERHDEDEDSPFSVPDLPDDHEPDWLTEPGAVLTPVERFLADSVRFHYIIERQEAILGRTDALLASGLSMYLEDLRRASAPRQLAAIFEESRERSRDLLLANPLALPLPGLPRASGESRDFARLIRARLGEFLSHWPLFRPLLVPVTLTFLVIPPEQGKDLDNIALTALPIAHEVLRPHIEPHLLAPSYRDDPSEAWRVEALARLRSVNALSVRAYQVIELPRSPQDQPEGTLLLALGRHSHGSWWDHAATYLDKEIEEAEQRDELGDSSWESVFARW